ncbi:spondin-1-like isoform X4 [Oppia nitens]|uniref:spondin-1-like isoform X4 n=1 Tax=Oppia nitens TaxID=1686743 RepID=UPI0023DA93A0|nr:spondin-1-like isoform X4 [Oppia nitens]
MMKQLQRLTLMFVSYKTSICLLLVTILAFIQQFSESDAEVITSSPYSRYGASYQTTSCSREPTNVATTQTKGNNGFKIKLSGNPEKYVPGEMYTVVLQGDQRISKSTTSVHKFIEFLLVVEPLQETRQEMTSAATGPPILPDVGQFQLYSDSLVKLSDDCPNAVTHTSSVSKMEISVMWHAPAPGSGCVVFKATVVERKDMWYMDDSGLTKVICEEESESNDEQPDIIEECCACDEAKYEVTFEGLWSKYTHPKDFPANFWLTHFSDIIGASHSADFRMWEYGGYASEGVRQVAELGVTKKLESELKAESNKIRTIIKARGLWHPNLNGKTFAVFRVDSKHHLMSLLSMLGPSPDWIVGVSALELCLKNCSWVTEKVMNLYLWDAGTDSGITYLAPNHPTVPQERIRRITSTNPNNPESPFYDHTGAKMKPIAKLTVSRQRIYEKACGDDNNNNKLSPICVGYDCEDKDEDDSRRTPSTGDCQVTEWTEFTPCSATCGHGIRMRTRNYKHEQLARQMSCLTKLVEKESCEVKCVNDVSCDTTSWTEWGECSAVCGKGFRTRSRKFMNRMARKLCNQVELDEKDVCMGSQIQCQEPEEIDPKCSVTQWSEWTPCTVTCGKGVKIRTRLYMSPRQSSNMCNIELIQKAPCVADKIDCKVDLSEAKETCMQNKEVGPCRGYFPRYYYDVSKGMCYQFIYGGCRGNKNNFERYADCKRMCEDMLKTPIGALTSLTSGSVNTGQSLSPINDQGPIIDCVLTPWSEWTSCSRTCGSARKERRREIKLNAQNGGKPCPKRLVQRRKCKENPECDNTPVDCIMGSWGEWSTCSKTCDGQGFRFRQRSILMNATNGGISCGPQFDRQICSNYKPCY